LATNAEGADLPALFEKLSRSGAAGPPCGAGDEEAQIGHLLDSKDSNRYLDVQ
jgi:hypothetical protein